MLEELESILITPEVSALICQRFENEHETIKQLRKLPLHIRSQLDDLYLRSLETLAEETDCIEKREEQSNRLRTEGNKVFRNKRNASDVLNACRLYTLAIFAAPPSSKALSLAYANRGIALQDFGYYQQAYDDCECARDNGYPAKLHAKLAIRQAFCAIRLANFPAARAHIDALNASNLANGLQAQLNDIQSEYAHLMQAEASKSVQNEQPEETNFKIQIVQAAAPRGRYMIARADIKCDELVFAENATSFVPVGSRLICQQCAATQLIPIPCANCYARVVYCSLACKRAQQATHGYECAAYQRELFQKYGIAHLALRVVLDELSQNVHKLIELQHIDEAWRTCAAVSESKQSSVHALSLTTHMSKMEPTDILQFAVTAELLLTYLVKHTDFFLLFSRSSIELPDWHTFTAALILRACGQLVANAHTTSTLVFSSSSESLATNYVALLDPAIWTRPQHVRLGQLHRMSECEIVSSANVPLLSMCNHACSPSFDIKFNGRTVKTYANKTITAGDEIFNCYTPTYRKYNRAKRQAMLQSSHFFTCTCSHCQEEQSVAYHEQFVRYRCEDMNCGREFVPRAQEADWWLNDSVMLCCTHCDLPQKASWFNEFYMLLEHTVTTAQRNALYECFARLERWLVGQHELRCLLAAELLANCFDNEDTAKQPLSDLEYTRLIDINKFCLDVIAAQSGKFCLEYLAKSTYLWDMIALGKYQCSNDEMQTYLTAVHWASDEHQIIFRNYFDENIRHLLRV